MVQELKMLSLTKIFMVMVGAWKYTNLSYLNFFVYNFLSSCYVLYFIVMCADVLATVFLKWECNARVIELIAYFIQYTNIIIMVYLLVKSPSIRRCVDTILNYEENDLVKEDEESKVIYNRYAISNSKITVFLICCNSFAAVFWYTVAIRYIFSLALADLLVILTCVPFTSIIYTLESWPWGGVICKISESVKDISIGVSVFTLTALSAERYCAVVNPLRRLQTKPLTVISAGMIWLLATGFAIPDAICSGLYHAEIDSNKTITYCSPWPNITNVEIYMQYAIVIKSLIYYFIPLATIACFYVLMAIRLHHSANDMPGEIRGTQSLAQVRARRHVARMVLIFVFLFFICFLPHHVFMLWFHLYPDAKDEYNDWWHALKIIGFCLSFLNSCVNPVALYCVSGVFRAHFNRYLCCRDPRWPRNTLSTANCETSFNSTYRRHTQNTMVESQSIYRKGTVARKHNEDLNFLTSSHNKNDDGLKKPMIMRSEMELDRTGYCS